MSDAAALPDKSAPEDDLPGQQPTIEERPVLMQAFIDNRMEKDRTIVTLSGGGLGLIMTLLTTDRLSGGLTGILAGIAAIAFSAALVVGLLILTENANFLKRLAIGDRTPPATLDSLDRWFFWTFGIGAGLVLAISLALLFA